MVIQGCVIRVMVQFNLCEKRRLSVITARSQRAFCSIHIMLFCMFTVVNWSPGSCHAKTTAKRCPLIYREDFLQDQEMVCPLSEVMHAVRSCGISCLEKEVFTTLRRPCMWMMTSAQLPHSPSICTVKFLYAHRRTAKAYSTTHPEHCVQNGMYHMLLSA